MDATSFRLTASADSDEYGICSNTHLFNNARCIGYELNLSVGGDELTYDETSTLVMNEYDEPFVHTDKNVLTRTEAFEIPPPAKA